MNPEWVDIARKDIGNPESLGPNDSPFIRKMLAKVNGLWLKGQPWCGSVMAYWMQQAGLAYPKDFYRAKSWASWGTACGAVLGAVAVFERTGGGHVGLCVGRGPNGTLIVLGGNQGDCVSERAFDPGRVIAYRWPPGKGFFDAAPLTAVANSQPLSTNEA